MIYTEHEALAINAAYHSLPAAVYLKYDNWINGCKIPRFKGKKPGSAYHCTRQPGHTGVHECVVNWAGKSYSAARWYTEL